MVANKDFPSGIDFDEKKLLTKKVGRNLRKFYIWRFDCISTVIQGKTSSKEINEALEKFNWINGERLDEIKGYDLESEEEIVQEMSAAESSEDTENPDRDFYGFDSSWYDNSSSEDEDSENTDELRYSNLRYSDFEISSEDE